MSAYALHPTFKNVTEYKSWRSTWKRIYLRLSSDIRREKNRAKDGQRASLDGIGVKQRELLQMRAMAAKTMSLLKDAKMRMARITEANNAIKRQASQFPLSLECKVVDFHFNKAGMEISDKLPLWVLKTRGMTFYLDHVKSEVPFSTHEMATGSTKGTFRLRNCRVILSPDNTACIVSR